MINVVMNVFILIANMKLLQFKQDLQNLNKAVREFLEDMEGKYQLIEAK